MTKTDPVRTHDDLMEHKPKSLIRWNCAPNFLGGGFARLISPDRVAKTYNHNKNAFLYA